jgi:hypothetical protein
MKGGLALVAVVALAIAGCGGDGNGGGNGSTDEFGAPYVSGADVQAVHPGDTRQQVEAALDKTQDSDTSLSIQPYDECLRYAQTGAATGGFA